MRRSPDPPERRLPAAFEVCTKMPPTISVVADQSDSGKGQQAYSVFSWRTHFHREVALARGGKSLRDRDDVLGKESDLARMANPASASLRRT